MACHPALADGARGGTDAGRCHGDGFRHAMGASPHPSAADALDRLSRDRSGHLDFEVPDRTAPSRVRYRRQGEFAILPERPCRRVPGGLRRGGPCPDLRTATSGGKGLIAEKYAEKV